MDFQKGREDYNSRLHLWQSFCCYVLVSSTIKAYILEYAIRLISAHSRNSVKTH